MKQKDLALILVMVFVGAVLAIVISQMVFSSPKSRKQTAEKVDEITADFPEPSQKYFNHDSVNTAEHPANSPTQSNKN